MTDLFDVERNISGKARVATQREIKAYLEWLAARKGVTVPRLALYRPDGIFSADGLTCLLPMPGQDQPAICTMEVLDEAGQVVRCMTLPMNNRGALPIKAEHVVEATGLKPSRKRKRQPVPIEQLRAEIAPAVKVAPPTEAIGGQPLAKPKNDTPIDPATATTGDKTQTTADLVSLVAELGARVQALEAELRLLRQESAVQNEEARSAPEAPQAENSGWGTDEKFRAPHKRKVPARVQAKNSGRAYRGKVAGSVSRHAVNSNVHRRQRESFNLPVAIPLTAERNVQDAPFPYHLPDRSNPCSAMARAASP